MMCFRSTGVSDLAASRHSDPSISSSAALCKYTLTQIYILIHMFTQKADCAPSLLLDGDWPAGRREQQLD
jgi:hypothetical protein